jgi:hypothetical protein
VVFGSVVHAAVAPEVMVDGRPEFGLLRPLARLGKDEWSRPGEVVSVPRIRYADWPGNETPAKQTPGTQPPAE